MAVNKVLQRWSPTVGDIIRCCLSAAIVTCVGLPAATAQEKDGSREPQQEASQEEQESQVAQEAIDELNRVREAAERQRRDEDVETDQTGTDPRAFTNKFMPFLRSTELENGTRQLDATLFGTIGVSPEVGMIYEVPIGQRRDFSDVAGFPSGRQADVIGVGDASFKTLIKPAGLEFAYGQDGAKSGNVMVGWQLDFPTATQDALTGNAVKFAPLVAVVADMPFYGFVAMLNLYQFDAYKTDGTPDTSRYLGQWFYMQPLTPPGRWWGGFFLLPEFQPIYDFEMDDFSLWMGLEVGKVLGAGQIAYIKPGWGIRNSEPTDRKSTLEFGLRWFF